MNILDLQQLLKCNYFELFKLPIKFKIDPIILENQYHSLQKVNHPDSFSTGSDEVKLISTSLASRINDSYHTLKSPTLRAKLLLELNGINVNFAHDTKLPESFLIEQMETHEEIELSKDNIDKLDAIISNLEIKKTQIINQFEVEFENKNFSNIIELLKQLSFYDKLVLMVENNIQNAL